MSKLSLSKILLGHTDQISSVTFDPRDSTRLASGSRDETIRIWDLKTYTCVAVLEHTGSCVAFDPISDRLVSCSFDKTIRIWDMKTYECVNTLCDHSKVDSEGTRLASGSHDNTIRIWDMKTYECVGIILDDTGHVFELTFNPAGTHLASCGWDNGIRIWDVKTHECVAVLQHTDQVNSMAFDPTGTLLASGSEDKTIRIWDMKTYECVAVLRDHNNAVLSVAFDPSDSTRLASGLDNGTIRIWDMKTYECLTTLRGHNNAVYSMAFDSTGIRLASVSEDEIRIWENNSEKIFQLFLGLFGPKTNSSNSSIPRVFDPDRTLDRVARNYSKILDPNAIALTKNFL